VRRAAIASFTWTVRGDEIQISGDIIVSSIGGVDEIETCI
jgi:hypothetical protein